MGYYGVSYADYTMMQRLTKRFWRKFGMGLISWIIIAYRSIHFIFIFHKRAVEGIGHWKLEIDMDWGENYAGTWSGRTVKLQEEGDGEIEIFKFD